MTDLTRIILNALLMLFCTSLCAKPVTLLSVFDDALGHDPTYLGQIAAYKASEQALPESMAAVLPQVTISAAIAREYQMMGQLGRGVFHTNNVSLQASQTIFNYTQFSQIQQAGYSVRAAFATLSAQQQELMIRTAKAYLDVLQAHDLQTFAKEQKNYILKQLEATKALFDHHDATITDVEQAQGAYDTIASEYYAAKIRLYDAIQTLSEITGIIYCDFSYLKVDFPLIKPMPMRLQTWTDTANKNNWNLRAARFSVDAYREAIHAAEGNFLPNVSATAGVTNAQVPSLLLIDNVPNYTNTIGLNANWNAFQGGLTRAQVKIAVANLQQAQADLRKQYLQTLSSTRKAYNTILVGAKRVERIRASLEANTKALNHAEEAYKAGELTITEILQIQYQLYRAQTLYTEYVYGYLINILLLKQAAGTLDVCSLSEINSWLVIKKRGITKK